MEKTEQQEQREGFWANRGAGFWLYLLLAVLLAATSVAYYFFFQERALIRYYSDATLILPLIGLGVSLVLAFIRPLSKWAPLVLFAANFYALCQFFAGSYLYLSSYFYGGVSLEAIAGMDTGYLVCAAGYLVVFVLGLFAVFMSADKKERTGEEKGE